MKWSTLWAALLALVLSAITHAQASQRLTGVPAFTDIQDLPYLRTGVQTHQFTSYDRAGDNYDADYFPIYTEPDGSNVIFDAYGPGCLYRLHANLWNGDLTGVKIRFTFDDEVKPRIDMDVTKFFSPENPLGIFKEPYAHIGQGWRFVYQPFFFKKRLKISLNKEPLGNAPGWEKLPWLGKYDKHPYRRNHWYNFTYQTYTEAPWLQSWSNPAEMTPVAFLWDPRKIGQPINTLAYAVPHLLSGGGKFTFHGPGVIQNLHVKLKNPSPETLFNTTLQIRFDGSKTPQVDVPLGCFFGVYRTHPEKRIASRFVGCRGDDMYCYLPMPYWKSAEISFASSGTGSKNEVEARLEVNPNRLSASECGYFHAVYHSANPREEGHDYRYVDLTGQGHFIGHFTFRTNTSMEEDERTYFDGSQTPWIIGEGFEDDHNQGWGLRDAQQAIWGSTGSDGGSGAPWRFYIPDLYVFNSAIKAGHQVYGPHSPRGHEGMYEVGKEESVAFLYAKDQPGLIQTDELDPGNAKSEIAHRYKVAGNRQNRTGSWWYDGEFNNVLFRTPVITDDGVSTDTGSEFRIKIDPANHGVKLRRRTDKENNQQLAQVYVDGALVKERPWYSVDFERTFRDIRWFDSDFEIPATYTRGKHSITVRIKFVSSKTGRWDEFRYWAFSYR